MMSRFYSYSINFVQVTSSTSFGDVVYSPEIVSRRPLRKIKFCNFFIISTSILLIMIMIVPINCPMLSPVTLYLNLLIKNRFNLCKSKRKVFRILPQNFIANTYTHSSYCNRNNSVNWINHIVFIMRYMIQHRHDRQVSKEYPKGIFT